jgi:hypothetical protein
LALGLPWTYLPYAARIYCRHSQLPPGETFHTKTAWTVVGPYLSDGPGQWQIEILTRLRVDARLYQSVVSRPRLNRHRPKWGTQLAAPQHHIAVFSQLLVALEEREKPQQALAL